MTAGIYIHVPFCSGKCGYCDFYSAPSDPVSMDAYTASLIRHIKSTSSKIAADTVYFGGGTPSLLGADNLIAILAAVRGTFDLAPNAQITLEANPGDICMMPGIPGDAHEVLAKLRGAGFDRISFGVQSACDGMLKKLGRRHDFLTAQAAVHAAKAAGFDDISLDLMYALPDQSMDDWRASIDAIVALEPTHISCYALKLEPDAPLAALADRQPDEDTQLAMYLEMVERLKNAGFDQYEISNFARDGKISRHNVKYWRGMPYYGFGPSAHSMADGVRYAWVDDTAAYTRGEYTYKYREALTELDRMEERIMLSLRTTDGFDLVAFATEFSQSAPKYARILDKYVPSGYVLRDKNRYMLSPRGMFVSDYIIAELFGAIEERNS